MAGIEAFDGFEAAEIAYIIELLAAMSSTKEIQNKVREFTTPPKALGIKTLQKIQLRFAKQIRERNEAYLRNVEGNPLAHQRVRLDILQRIIDDCLIQRPSHAVKTGEDNFEVVTKADNNNAINAVKLAMTDINKSQELALEKKKQEEFEQSTPDFEVDVG